MKYKYVAFKKKIKYHVMPHFLCLIKPFEQINISLIINKIEIEVVCQSPGSGGTHCEGDIVNT